MGKPQMMSASISGIAEEMLSGAQHSGGLRRGAGHGVLFIFPAVKERRDEVS